MVPKIYRAADFTTPKIVTKIKRNKSKTENHF